MKSKSGQMLMEVLFALSIVVIALLALMGAAITSLKNARHSKNMVLANHYTQQAMENVRAYKNRNEFDALVGDCSGNPCCYEEITSSGLGDIINCSSGWGSIDSVFQRRIEIEDEEVDLKKVTAIISWTDTGCGTDNLCEAEIVGYLSQWSN